MDGCICSSILYIISFTSGSVTSESTPAKLIGALAVDEVVGARVQIDGGDICRFVVPDMRVGRYLQIEGKRK